MFKRLAFNCIIHNGDDHLRNHGFIYLKNGYALSPVFDINPDDEAMRLSLSIDGFDFTFNIDKCIEISYFFGLTETEANQIVINMKQAIKDNYPYLIKDCHLSNKEIEMFNYLISD